MTATLAQRGYGAQVWYASAASPLGFTKLAEVKRFSGFGISKPQVPATHLESPDDTEENIPGMKIGKQPTLTCNLTTANQAVLQTLIDSTVNINFRLIFPGGLTGRQFAGTPVDLEYGEATPDGVLEVTFQFKIAGAISVL